MLSADSAGGYRSPDPRYRMLFNSYYDAVGERFERARRGTLSRPSLTEVRAYRRQVDDAVMRLLEEGNTSPTVLTTIELGLHHEQQHQELLLTDIKHALGSNPLQPAFVALSAQRRCSRRGGASVHDVSDLHGRHRLDRARRVRFRFRQRRATAQSVLALIRTRRSARHLRGVPPLHARRRVSTPGALAFRRLAAVPAGTVAGAALLAVAPGR